MTMAVKLNETSWGANDQIATFLKRFDLAFGSNSTVQRYDSKVRIRREFQRFMMDLQCEFFSGGEHKCTWLVMLRVFEILEQRQKKSRCFARSRLCNPDDILTGA